MALAVPPQNPAQLSALPGVGRSLFVARRTLLSPTFMPWHRDRHPRLVIGAEEHFVLQAGAARCTVVACQGAVEWPPESGFIWISCETGANRFYISRTEISNARYQRFVTSEAYATYGLDHKRPRWWNGENNAPPEYHRGGKTLLPDKFPVTGVSPVEAEAFAEEVFGEGTRLASA